jgi:hypothetical protein
MRLKRPSPATVISIIALVMATTGSAVAAVDFARNAGAVDGKSAVAASSSRSHAAGRLVATNSKGPDKGQLPGKFVAGVVQGEGGTSTFGRAFDVADNAVVAPVPMVDVPGIGRLAASCVDQNKTVAKEDPSTTITFTNTSATGVNFARSLGTGGVEVIPLAAGIVNSFTIGGSNTFVEHVEQAGKNLVITGTVRQDGRNTAAASCLIYGTAVRLG